MGLTTLRMRDWLWISLVARIPSIITSTIGGNALGEQNLSLIHIFNGLAPYN